MGGSSQKFRSLTNMFEPCDSITSAHVNEAGLAVGRPVLQDFFQVLLEHVKNRAGSSKPMLQSQGFGGVQFSWMIDGRGPQTSTLQKLVG